MTEQATQSDLADSDGFSRDDHGKIDNTFWKIPALSNEFKHKQEGEEDSMKKNSVKKQNVTSFPFLRVRFYPFALPFSKHTHACADAHTQARTQTNIQAHSRAHECTHRCARTHTHSYTHTHAHAHTHTHVYTKTHTNTDTHTTFLMPVFFAYCESE